MERKDEYGTVEDEDVVKETSIKEDEEVNGEGSCEK